MHVFLVIGLLAVEKTTASKGVSGICYKVTKLQLLQL